MRLRVLQNCYRVPLIALLAFTGGCASNPPLGALDVAEARILAAREARARQYSPDELDRADRLLAAARAAIEEREYRDAERLAERAEVEAELALVRAQHAMAEAEVARKREENADLRRRLLGERP